MRFSSAISFLGLAVAPVSAVWPVPSSISTGNSTLWIQEGVVVTYNKYILPLTASESWPPCSQDIVTGGVVRAMDSIFKKNFVPWKLYKRNALNQTEPTVGPGMIFISRLDITQTGTDNASTWKPLDGEVDESYTLNIDLTGNAAITAASAVGVLRALETFTQLFFQHSEGRIYTRSAPVNITDSPKFPHRGLLLDVARCFYDVDTILKTIDAMAYNKMNKLHIHITDSQAWPLEIPSMPEVSAKGAYDPSAVYSAADLTKILQYGSERGVFVYLEIDSPGHIGSIALSHPDLITAWEAAPWGTYCAEPPCGQFQLNNSAVDTFLDKLMGDLLPRLAPYSAYFHTGGDEINAQAYLIDPTVRSNDSSAWQPLLQKFIDKQHARVRNAGLTPMVWEEIPQDFNVQIGSDVVVQSWLGSGTVQNMTKQGHKVIDSNYNIYYLDCGRGQWLNFKNGDEFQKFYPFNDYCSPAKSWRLIYSYDSTAGLSANESKLVLGGEVAMWSETTDPINLDSLLWPRGSAAAEIWWSGAHDAQGNNRSQLDAAPRLAEFRERMVVRGINSGVVQMPYCTQGMNGTICDFGS